MHQNSETIKRLAGICHALGHPVRIKIVVLLNTKGPMTVTALHEALSLSQPQISRQLSVLKNASLVLFQKQGPCSHYYINENNLPVRMISECLTKTITHTIETNEK
jgi:ArsR family transcriptional regulator